MENQRVIKYNGTKKAKKETKTSENKKVETEQIEKKLKEPAQKKPKSKKINTKDLKLEQELELSKEIEEVAEEAKIEEELKNIYANDAIEDTVEMEDNKKKHHLALFISLSVILIVALLFCIYHVFTPTIKLKGSKNVELNYEEKYKEKGYTAKYLGKDITDKVKTNGKVNSKKLGTYKITYSSNAGLFKKKVTRNVIVTDNSKPVINLVSNDDIYICPNTNYETEEYTAFDNYDGDITKKVKITQDDDKITYTVTDSHGNKNSKSRKIIHEDKTPPTINLNGSNIAYAFINEEFKDPGYTATDNCDGDLTSKVSVTGSVDITKTGEYTLTYTVTDTSENKAEVTRKVIVSRRGQNGTIYLTFDDGPNQGTTNVILDILKEEGVKATFFVTNKGDDALIKREFDEGHTVALHTASHDYAIVYASVDSYFSDLQIVSNRVERITGQKSKIIRFPGGSSNTVSRHYCNGIMSTLTSEVLQRGYRYYDWNVSSGDAAGGSPSPNDIYNNVVNSLSRTRVNMVLMHDIKTYTRDALRDIIHYGKENGYVFERITEGTEMVTQRVNN